MKILLAIDASKYSQDAVRTVARQFLTKGTQVRVLNVVEPVPAYVSADLYPHLVHDTIEIERERRRQAKELVGRTAQSLRKTGFSVSERVDGGSAKARILDHAKEWRADLIVLGSHGLTGLDRLLMGSVSEAVSRHASCSVEVVRLRGSAPRGASGKSKR